MHIPLVDLQRNYASLKEDIEATLKEVAASGQYVLGRYVEEFEGEFARYCGGRYCIGVGSGTSALHLALLAAGVGPGDEVITAANTFIATVLAIVYTGATPVLVDIDPSTYLMDTRLLARAVTARTKAVIPVHLYGQCAPMDVIAGIASARGITVIEDAAQAHGALYKNAKSGSFGDLACFSFYPSKNLGALGDGGAVVTGCQTTAQAVRKLRDFGSERKYYHDCIGFNSRLDSMQAAVLNVKLKKLDQWNDARRAHAARYRELLDGLDIALPVEAEHCRHVYHLYVIRVKERDKLLMHLEARGIHAGIHYPIPVHCTQACKGLGYGEGSFPVTEKYAGEILSLPLFPEMTDEEITHIASALRDFYKSRA